MVIVERKGAKALSSRRRKDALTLADRKMIAKYRDGQLSFFLAALRHRHIPRIYVVMLLMSLHCHFKKEELRLYDWQRLPPPVAPKLYLIESFSREQCYQMFRFMKKYLRKLFTGLGVYTLPEWVRLDSGHLYHREMMFLLLLNRYALAGKFYVLYTQGWGYECTLSRAFNYAAQFLNRRFGPLIANDLDRTARKFPAFNAAITKKLREKIPAPNPLPRDARRMALALDGTRRDVGCSADVAVEAATFSWYTGTHCHGYLSLGGPDGLFCFTHHQQGKDSDIAMVRDSNVNQELMLSQQRAGIVANFFWAYGDKIFQDMLCVRAAPRGGRYHYVPQALLLEHAPLRSVRVLIEMMYGNVCNLWKYVDYDPAQHILLCPIALHYMNILLLTNCHTILQGMSVGHRMFDVEPPSLQEYLGFQWDDNLNALYDHD
jgi:hypothetical protein